MVAYDNDMIVTILRNYFFQVFNYKNASIKNSSCIYIKLFKLHFF